MPETRDEGALEPCPAPGARCTPAPWIPLPPCARAKMSLHPMLGPARVLVMEPPLRLPFPDTCVWGQAALEDGGGKMAGGGSPRNPTSGHAAPHPSQWCGGHPAEV